MAMALPQYALAQKNQFNPIETGVVSLGIAPDARAAGMGDLSGAATDPRRLQPVLESVEICICL